MKDTIKIPLLNHTIRLTFKSFEEEIDIDDLTKIHYDNLSGEIITISALLNRIGLLKAEAENEVTIGKHRREVLAANKRKYYNSICDKLTIQQLEDKVLLDEEYQISIKDQQDNQRVFAIVDSLYWAIHSKSQKLSVLMKGTTPEEFEKEIVEGFINGFFIKKIENSIR